MKAIVVPCNSDAMELMVYSDILRRFRIQDLRMTKELVYDLSGLWRDEIDRSIIHQFYGPSFGICYFNPRYLSPLSSQ